MATPEALGDRIALKIQELRHSQSDPRPLLRIDNREEAAEAPFQFDTVTARLHRRGCRAIPSGSRTALYGLWHIPPQAGLRACRTCRPLVEDRPDVADENGGTPDGTPEGTTDYVFGVLSVLDQFGSVIRERGREFRASEHGRQLGAGLDGFYRSLEERERTALTVILRSLDGLLATIADIDSSLDAGARRNGDAGPH